MDFKIILSQPAIQDLRDLVSHIARDHPAAAENLGVALIHQTRKLASFPELGRRAPDVEDASIREIVFKSYRIFYRINPQQRVVEVIRFWHGARGCPVIPQTEF